MLAPTTVLAAAAFATALLIGYPMANAQQPAPKPAGDQPPKSAGDQPRTQNIPDEKLDAAADALADAAQVRRDYQQRIASASPADRERIAGEGDDALKQAVTSKGLSVEEYNKILQVAQDDPGIREKLIDRANTRNNK
jgi:hypothetical protein